MDTTRPLYLMLLTKDKKAFFTGKENYNTLVEYAKTFSAQMYEVEVSAGEKSVLNLNKLLVALCNPDYDNSKSDVAYKTTVRLYPEKGRDKILKSAENIQTFIRKKMASGKVVSLKELKEKYKEMKITDACLCNHLSSVRKSLAQEGHTVKKVAAGAYCVAK